jgi:hypothetical protein
MNSIRIKRITPPSFALLVRQLKKYSKDADGFEVDLDAMRVKGDLAVIKKAFPKVLIAKATSLDLARRGAKAGWDYVHVPEDLETDLEFKTLTNNKGVQLIRGKDLPTPLVYTEELA